VTDVPGTTRDVVEESVMLGSWPLVLQDTAGVREAGDEVERLGIGRTLISVAEADLLIAVFDSSRPFEDDDARVLALCEGRAGVALLNKSDLRPPRLSPGDLLGRGLAMPMLRFSAFSAEDPPALRTTASRSPASAIARRSRRLWKRSRALTRARFRGCRRRSSRSTWLPRPRPWARSPVRSAPRTYSTRCFASSVSESSFMLQLVETLGSDDRICGAWRGAPREP
jgi:hypothetical protein